MELRSRVIQLTAQILVIGYPTIVRNIMGTGGRDVQSICHRVCSSGHRLHDLGRKSRPRTCPAPERKKRSAAHRAGRMSRICSQGRLAPFIPTGMTGNFCGAASRILAARSARALQNRSPRSSDVCRMPFHFGRLDRFFPLTKLLEKPWNPCDACLLTARIKSRLPR